MLDLIARPLQDRELLVDAALRPPGQPSVHKGAEMGTTAADQLRRKPSRVQIGVPQTLDILHAWPKQEERLATEISVAMERFDFYSIRLACSFVPGRGCRFVWARFTAELEVDGSATAERPQAVALDLFPVQVARETKYKRSYAIRPTMKYAFAEVAGEIHAESEAVRYEPTLTAAGLLTSSPSWTFAGLDREGLIGSRELFMVVKKPKGADLEAHFAASAEVQTLLGRFAVHSQLDPTAAVARHRLVPG